MPREPRVKRALLDLEKLVWKAIPKVLPTVKLSGCGFHWSQAVWRKVWKWGLEKETTTRNLFLLVFYYLIRSNIWDFRLPTMSTDRPRCSRGKSCSYHMCPQTTLRTCLTGSYNRLTRTPPYKTFFNTWEKHGNIGTNSYIEGWHNRMNQRASYRHQLQFYLLVKFQHSEAMLAKLQVELVSQAKLTRIQRKRYRDMQSKIIRLWDRFDNDEIDSYRLYFVW